MKLLSLFVSIAILSTFLTASLARAEVTVHDNQLFLDGNAQPQLFGAERQYFRLRGGYSRNQPREKVIALWNEALDRMVEAHMNTISFYIPWDFHEYAPGKFDFDGTVDEDGDGRPDYPSRDLHTFIRLVKEHGFKSIMVRPGPYINAEWGFLGFGAIPLWFHERYPDSHMRSPEGLRTKLYDYHSPELLAATRKWFTKLYQEVLKDEIGPGKPVRFLQIDNETNFMWQSIYNHDYSETAQQRYRTFLLLRDGSLDAVNLAHGRSYLNWDAVHPPVIPGLNLAEDQDWYRFQDESIHSYLHEIRSMWEDLGVHEPQVLFTLAESYNAMEHGLLPNFGNRNDSRPETATGMMTVNLYPKTYDPPSHPLLNNPFKADHDVKAVSAANDAYLGSHGEWAMGPEIQGGWWPGTPVSDSARKQTYLSVIGHGLKAFYVYYFTEGDQWQSEWAFHQVKPLYSALHAEGAYAAVSDEGQLGQGFWDELQKRVDRKLVVGFNAWGILHDDATRAQELHFDAPLDRGLKPGSHFALLKEIGEKITAPYGEFLSQAVELTSPVRFLMSDSSHVPSSEVLDSVVMNSDWSGGLLGLFLHAGFNPKIEHLNLTAISAESNAPELLVIQDNGGWNLADLKTRLNKANSHDDSVLSFFQVTAANTAGIGITAHALSSSERKTGTALGIEPYFEYDLTRAPFCVPLRFLAGTQRPIAVRCAWGKGFFTQVGALLHGDLNSSDWAGGESLQTRISLLKNWIAPFSPQILVQGASDRVAAFSRGRANAVFPRWMTFKSNSLEAVHAQVYLPELNSKFLSRPGLALEVRELLSGRISRYTAAQIADSGFALTLDPQGSDVYVLEEAK